MNSTKTWLIAILVIGALSALSIYAWQTTLVFTEQTAVKTATRFLSEAPTYSWDGVEGSIQVLDSYKTQTPEAVWTVVIEFTCANAGYGDRSGQMVASVVTDHVVTITVEDGAVVKADVDSVWDELRQTMAMHDDTTPMEAEEMAIEFVESSPTFSFDGVPGSIEVIDIVAAESYPVQYFITVAFECSHAGYGDRTGQVLAQVITRHVMRLTVSDDRVLSAVIDGQWDEVNQREKVVSELLPPDMAKDIAVSYVIEHYEELSDVVAPAEWAEIHEGGLPALIGYTKRMYAAGDWNVHVGYAVVPRPVYRVEIEYGGEPAFNWNGTVDQSSTVTELSTSLTANQTDILGPEQARDIAVEYVTANYPELADEEHGVWEMENLTPEGLMGFSRLQYTSEGWTVEVSFPVVWKPTYSVELTVDTEPVFEWMGSVDQDGSVTPVTE
ncbi:hypothetical protein KAT55_02970 [Candidatus Bathyarchaeota archaeon]|nr:hypothetical protein [Candidatus Bathyarchaeota archaeon]